MYFDPGGEDRLSVNIRGFGAELAASYASGLAVNWDYLPSHYRRARKPPDLGRRTEVRNARSHRGRLWASKHDPISRVFLLVTGIMPSFRVRGWLEGAELKVPERHLEPPAVRYEGYFAEPDELNPLPLPEDA